MKKGMSSITVCGAIMFSQVSISAMKPDLNNINEVQKPHYISKEVLVDLGLPANITFGNVNGDQRILEAGEKIEVTTHEETGLINFTTFDKYSLSVPLGELQAPRNVSGETPY